MTNLETLERANFKRCEHPYRTENETQYYRAIHENRRTGEVIVFEQTPISFPNYRFVCRVKFARGLIIKL